MHDTDFYSGQKCRKYVNFCNELLRGLTSLKINSWKTVHFQLYEYKQVVCIMLVA